MNPTLPNEPLTITITEAGSEVLALRTACKYALACCRQWRSVDGGRHYSDLIRHLEIALYGDSLLDAEAALEEVEAEYTDLAASVQEGGEVSWSDLDEASRRHLFAVKRLDALKARMGEDTEEETLPEPDVWEPDFAPECEPDCFDLEPSPYEGTYSED
jgi:hypothetical protein